MGPAIQFYLRFSLLTVLTEKSIREAKFSSPVLRISATVTGEQFFSSSRLRRFRPVVYEPSTTEEICDGRKEISDGVEELSIGCCYDRCRQDDPEESHGGGAIVSGAGVSPD